MKKKICIIVLLIVAIVILIYAGLRIVNVSDGNDVLTNIENVTETETTKTPGEIVEIDLSDIEAIAQNKNYLTKHEAEELCLDVLGDTAEENGFSISYSCIGAVKADDELYYVMHIAWLVDNNHWSYIGNCYVSIDGEEIYDGVAFSGEYEMTELIWEK